LAVLVETEKDYDEDSVISSRVRYQLSNHLGSAVLEVDKTAAARVISYEEYYPYGGSAHMAGLDETEAMQKRYRYSGKERDDETGLFYYGTRYFVPWMARWISCDQALNIDGNNLYVFVKNNPIKLFDKSGLKSCGDPIEKAPRPNSNNYQNIQPGGNPEPSDYGQLDFEFEEVTIPELIIDLGPVDEYDFMGEGNSSIFDAYDQNDAYDFSGVDNSNLFEGSDLDFGFGSSDENKNFSQTTNIYWASGFAVRIPGFSGKVYGQYYGLPGVKRRT
jgi:RHS repeat-associated protein